jgi:hypothetical protein
VVRRGRLVAAGRMHRQAHRSAATASRWSPSTSTIRLP